VLYINDKIIYSVVCRKNLWVSVFANRELYSETYRGIGSVLEQIS